MNARMFNENNLPHELLLTTRRTIKLRNPIENNMSTDIKVSKAQISKIIQLGKLLLGPLLKTGFSLIKISHKTNWIIGFNSCKLSNRLQGFKKRYIVILEQQS